MSEEAKFLTGSTLRHVTVMALSSTVGLMAVFLVDFVDMIFIAMLGKAELAAAIGYAGAILFFTGSFGIGVAIACGALVARALGAGDRALAQHTATNALIVGFVGGGVFAALIWVFTPQLVGFLGASGDTLALAVTFMRIILPSLPVLLIGIVGFALVEGDAGAAADFLLTPDFSEVTMGTFLEAVGQAFFSLSVGSCLMITYGAYLSRDTNIPRASAIVASADTMVALIAGFAIFPIVFAFGADPAGGPGLFFVSMPIAFSQMGALGVWVGGAFFLLALFAAFTSSISLMEVGVAWLEEREGVTRPGAAMGIGFMLFMIGMGYVYSTDFIDFADIITGNIMLPLCALLLAVFAGWIVSREMLTTELGEGTIMNLWRFMCRWIVPPALASILVLGTLTKLGVI